MIDISKKYETRDRREVRIYAIDGGGDNPIQGAVYTHGRWLLMLWLANGLHWRGAISDLDLIEVKPRHKRTVWLNVYEDGVAAHQHDDKNYADVRAGPTRIACIKVELDFEEGEGL